MCFCWYALTERTTSKRKPGKRGRSSFSRCLSITAAEQGRERKARTRRTAKTKGAKRDHVGTPLFFICLPCLALPCLVALFPFGPPSPSLGTSFHPFLFPQPDIPVCLLILLPLSLSIFAFAPSTLAFPVLPIQLPAHPTPCPTNTSTPHYVALPVHRSIHLCIISADLVLDP